MNVSAHKQTHSYATKCCEQLHSPLSSYCHHGDDHMGCLSQIVWSPPPSARQAPSIALQPQLIPPLSPAANTHTHTFLLPLSCLLLRWWKPCCVTPSVLTCYTLTGFQNTCITAHICHHLQNDCQALRAPHTSSSLNPDSGLSGRRPLVCIPRLLVSARASERWMQWLQAARLSLSLSY